jgi:hypothetical protein
MLTIGLSGLVISMTRQLGKPTQWAVMCGCVVLTMASAGCVGQGGHATQPILLQETVVNATDTVLPKDTSTLVATQTPGIKTPIIESRCTEQFTDSLQSLGVDSSAQLLVNLENNNPVAYYLIGNSTNYQPLDISDTAQFKRYGVFSVSPDEHWLALTADGPDESYDNLFILGASGGQPRLVSRNFTYPYAFWKTNTSMIAGVPPGGPTDFPQIMVLLDPFTAKSEQLDPTYLQDGIFGFSPDATQVIYVSGYPSVWSIYDFSTGQKAPVLPWLSSYATTIGDAVNWTSEGINIALADVDHLELFVGLSRDSVTPSDLNHYQVPVPQGYTNSSVGWWSSNGRLLGLFQSRLPANASRLETAFHIFDASRRVFYDYCLPQSLNPGRIHASSDGRFLAWVASLNDVKGVLVLDVLTGRRAWFPRISNIAGWVMQQGPS